MKSSTLPWCQVKEMRFGFHLDFVDLMHTFDCRVLAGQVNVHSLFRSKNVVLKHLLIDNILQCKGQWAHFLHEKSKSE